MNLYIILTRNIINIGGAEIYTRNKFLYLKERFDVVIFSCNCGKIYINELKNFKNYIFEELQIDPFFYSSNQRNRILSKIIKKINLREKYDNILIESQTVQLSLWGELLANKLNGRNFSLLTEDKFPNLTTSMTDFFKFKLFRKELAGISNVSLPLLFKNRYEVPESLRYGLPFLCSNSIENVPSLFPIEKTKFDVVIGTLTRLEKICVPFILDNVLLFAKNNPTKKILFIFFGGSSNKKYEKEIISKMSAYVNLSFCLTGIIFPVPLEMVEKVDLFISLAGAANATAKLAIPTLSIELVSGRPIGILGVTTNSAQYIENGEKYIGESINEVLEQIFIEKKIALKEIKEKLIQKEKKIIDFSSHEAFINDSMSKYEKSYYSFNNYRVPYFWKIIISTIYGLFGIKLLKFCLKIYRSFFKKG